MEKDYKKTGWVNGSEPDMDAEHMNNIEDGIDGLYHPVFDDSGTVEGITNFPQFLSTVVNKMNPIAFYKNFKAGMAFVLHAGQLVNNGLCNEPGKYPLDAAYGKTLYDYYDRLNSDIAQKADASNLENKTVVGTYNIPNITGVSTAPEQIAGGYHNVAKYSNGQCMYSMMVYVYTSAISNSIIGTISSQFSPKQDVSAYVYDVTGKRFLLVTIAPDGTIKLMTLEGTAIPESAVKARGSIVF